MQILPAPACVDMEVEASDRLGEGVVKDVVRFTGGSKKVVYRWLKQKFDFLKIKTASKFHLLNVIHMIY